MQVADGHREGAQDVSEPNPSYPSSSARRLLQSVGLVATLDRFALPPMLTAVAHDLGAPLSSVVAVAGGYFLAYGLGQPFWGMAADRWGRVRTMRATLFLAGTLTVAGALSGSLLAFGLSRILAGWLYGAAYPSALTYLGDTVATAQRQRAIASLMVGVALGTAVASVGAGGLVGVTSWRWAFALAGATSIAVAVTLGRLAEPTRTRRPTSPGAAVGLMLRSSPARRVLTFAFVEGAVLLGALTMLPPAAEYSGASPAVAGLATAVYGCAVLLASPLIGRWSTYWPPARLILVGGTALCAGCALVAVSQRPGVVAVAAALVGLAWVSTHSTLQTWATLVLPAQRATVVSWFAASLFVGSAAGADFVGGLVERGAFTAVFAGYAAGAVVLTVLATRARARWRAPSP